MILIPNAYDCPSLTPMRISLFNLGQVHDRTPLRVRVRVRMRVRVRIRVRVRVTWAKYTIAFSFNLNDCIKISSILAASTALRTSSQGQY